MKSETAEKVFRNKTVFFGVPIAILLMAFQVFQGVESILSFLLVVFSCLFLVTILIGWIIVVRSIFPKPEIFKYQRSRAEVAGWIYGHKDMGGLRFRLKDIVDYGVRRESDENKLKHTNTPPPVLVDANDAVKITSSFVSKGLLELGVSTTSVEEYKAIYINEKEWSKARVFPEPNELFFTPVRIAWDKFVWFLITLFSSAVSFYSKQILEFFGVVS